MSANKRHVRRHLFESRWFWTGAFVVWLAVVWGHSLMAAQASSAESSRFVTLVRPLFNLFGSTDEHLMTLAIRKTAHFLEYALLAVLATYMVKAWCGKRRKAYTLVAAICVTVPVVDEIIQTFVPGREGRLTDVLLDVCGCIAGFVLLQLLRRWHAGQPYRKTGQQ